MNAPKKIWFDIEECSAGPVKFNDDEILYIRADLVDELVEALKRLIVFHDDLYYVYSRTIELDKAALAKLEQEE